MSPEPDPRWMLSLDVAYAVEHADEVLRAWADVAAQAPEQLETEAVIRPLPHAPDVPADLRGRRCVHVAGRYVGPLQDAYAAVRRLRTITTPLLDRTAPVPVR